MTSSPAEKLGFQATWSMAVAAWWVAGSSPPSVGLAAVFGRPWLLRRTSGGAP